MTADVISEAEFLANMENIKREYPAPPRPEPSNAVAIKAMIGMFADDPTWDNFVRTVEAERAEYTDESDKDAAIRLPVEMQH